MEAKINWSGPNPGPVQWGQRILEKSSYEERGEYALLIADGYVLVDLRVMTQRNMDVNVAAKSNKPVAQGAETHIVATYDGTEIKIYLDGVLDSQTPLGVNAGHLLLKGPSTPPPGLDGALAIGNQTYTTRPRPFHGLIDEVALYATALPADRIQDHYRAHFTGFQYAAKFACGKSAGAVVAPGTYFTAVNVHNPTDAAIRVRARIAAALPGLKAGNVSEFIEADLGPDHALEIDCPDIFKLAATKAIEFLDMGGSENLSVNGSPFSLENCHRLRVRSVAWASWSRRPV
jgi:hypothetical protein